VEDPEQIRYEDVRFRVVEVCAARLEVARLNAPDLPLGARRRVLTRRTRWRRARGTGNIRAVPHRRSFWLVLLVAALGYAVSGVANASVTIGTMPLDSQYVTISQGQSRAAGNWDLAIFSGTDAVCMRVRTSTVGDAHNCLHVDYLSGKLSAGKNKTVPAYGVSGGSLIYAVMGPGVAKVTVTPRSARRSPIEVHTVRTRSEHRAAFFFGVRPSALPACAPLRLMAYDARRKRVASLRVSFGSLDCR
jgi:hypothetical protein